MVTRPDCSIYPWRVWFTRKKIRLYLGRHFHCQPHSMAQQMRNAAYRHGYKVSIRITPDGIDAIPTKIRRR